MPPRKTRTDQVQNPAEIQEQAQADILRRLAALREEKAQEAAEREEAARERAEQKEQLDAVQQQLCGVAVFPHTQRRLSSPDRITSNLARGWAVITSCVTFLIIIILSHHDTFGNHIIT
jgi:uncharacterized membrane protein YgaE (UPF0421/DUF939 family)